MSTDKSSEREAFVYWWRHKYSAADLEGIPEHVALNAAWAAWQARAALPQQAQDAMDARRCRYMLKHAGWRRRDGHTYLEVRVEDGADLSCLAMREKAIDAAIAKGEQSHG